MRQQRTIGQMLRLMAVLVMLGLPFVAQAAASAATDNTRRNTAEPKIGVVDLQRLMKESPQVQQAKTNMATQFARRKKALESRTADLAQSIDKLKNNADHMSDARREKLQSRIRDRQRVLQLEQSQYNDDVSDAEQKELDQMRSDIRNVINAYAKKHGFDLILGDSVLYADDKVDITDAILAQLKKR